MCEARQSRSCCWSSTGRLLRVLLGWGWFIHVWWLGVGWLVLFFFFLWKMWKTPMILKMGVEICGKWSVFECFMDVKVKRSQCLQEDFQPPPIWDQPRKSAETAKQILLNHRCTQ